MGQWAKEGGGGRGDKVEEMMGGRYRDKELTGFGGRELSLGLIWRESQPSRILANPFIP